jgi:AcrR family transcriptional regulator
LTPKTATREGHARTRSEDGDKRQAIVEAARRLFTTKGYETTTIAEVARMAGVAVGTVYLYFDNKNALLYAVRGDWDDKFLNFLATPELQAIPHHKRARPLMEACFEMCDNNAEMIQLMGLQPEMIGDWHGKESGRIEQAVQAFFNEAIAAGAFRPIDTQAAAALAYGMVEYALRQCYIAEGGESKQQYIDALVDAFEHWLVEPDLLDHDHKTR